MADKIATREAYGKALVELGEKYDFVVMDADDNSRLAAFFPFLFYGFARIPAAKLTRTVILEKVLPVRHIDNGQQFFFAVFRDKYTDYFCSCLAVR